MSVSGGPDIVENGLVLCLDAGNTKSYPGSGTVWTDLSRNGNNGTLTNGPTFSSANGGSIVFDGSNDYVETISNLTMIFNSFSVAAWFKTTQSADAKIFSNSNFYHPIQTFNGVMRICVSACTVGTSIINDNVWRLATVVGDSTSVRLYLNNNTTPEITQAALSTSVTSLWSLGRTGGSSNYLYSGNISQVSIYNRALTISEIAQNYNATKGRFRL